MASRNLTRALGVAVTAGAAALAPELSAGLVNRIEIGAEIDAVVAALDQ